MIVTVFGGRHHREKLEINNFRPLITLVTPSKLEPLKFEHITHYTSSDQKATNYIYHYLQFGPQEIRVYLAEGIDPYLWVKNIVLDYMGKND